MKHSLKPAQFVACDKEFKQKIIGLVGARNASDDRAKCLAYSQDKTEDLHFPPDFVVTPNSAVQISQIMKWANEYAVPVTVRGRGTGLAGAALALHGGICLSMEKFDRILQIDVQNMQAVVEPYIRNYDLQEKAQEAQLFYPPDPASYKICSLGGNIAHNAGGPKALKYGSTRGYVLELDLVMPNGDIITSGSRALKNSTGYSIKDVVIGSEGTLAIVTKAVLRLIAMPRYEKLMYATFSSVKSAVEAVHAILMAGLMPSGLELMERTALTYAKLYCKSNYPPIREDTQAHLLIELDGSNEAQIDADRHKITALLQAQGGMQSMFMAQDESEKKDMWKLRRNVYLGIKAQGVIKEMDISVPIGALPRVMDYMQRVGENHGFRCASYGHAGDGNLHVGIVPQEGRDAAQDIQKTEEGIYKIFAYVCQECHGTISGEHGIGLVQQPFINLPCSEEELAVMRSIKKAFDPNNILNPGKIFPL